MPDAADLAATPRGQDQPAGTTADVRLDIPINGVRLVDLAETARFRELDRMDAYYRGKQDDHKVYDWDGLFMGYGADSPIRPGWAVPYRQRRPGARHELPKLIVGRLTSMLFGTDRFPEIRVEGDEDAEDFIKAIATQSRLSVRMSEARNLGGAQGTAAMSYGWVAGKPRVYVHSAKHMHVLRWVDEDELIPGAVLKAFSYRRQVYDPARRRMRELVFYYARYWDEQREITWAPIPKEVAERHDWATVAPRKAEVTHGLGECPVVWIQNLPDSEDKDGESDFDGLCDMVDEINLLLSATTGGTRANVDPTLVVKMSPDRNDGTVRKGSGEAIFSEGGAEYLEIKGQAVQASVTLLKELRLLALDVAQVVLADPDKLAGAAQSAQALRILYAPMLAKLDSLREQYGEVGVKRVLLGLLHGAKMIMEAPEQLNPATGLMEKPVLLLGKRAVNEEVEAKVPDEVLGEPRKVKETETKYVERTPGDSEEIVLNWNPYFAPTWPDIKAATEAAKLANGGLPVISQRTSLQAVQTLWGVNDVDAEMRELEADADRQLLLQQKAMEDANAEAAPPGNSGPGGEGSREPAAS